MKNKILWIVAGANGSGKTSLVLVHSSRFQDQVPHIVNSLDLKDIL